MSETAPPRYDVMIVPSSPGFKAATNLIRTMVQTLAFRGFAKPIDEAIGKDWVEIYMEPGPAAHEVFHKTGYAGPMPVFHEAVFRAGDQPAELDYGPQSVPIYVYLEFRGCVFQEPLGPFRKLLLNALHLRALVHVREHTALKPHLSVPEGDGPIDPDKKKERGPGTVGSDVQEW
ncbi:MAG: hypothetical protein AUK47_24135 [Deltaproteobacteria bacterium CG2_30_63_29]|nr:MAG: hypothetical protein AUK47_24135 [Deltaproteobacteria bacterium CG2_30_63_29]PJB41285.1 MAG: hypothetical protein CO108_13315 [Deltaproteobacteria bacterium CG_4_9_14_3_um_filter_63_12]